MADQVPSTVRFHYIKSSQFRVIHVDGIIGGPTPSGALHIAMFNDRIAIPQLVEHAFREDGTLGEEILERRVTKDGVVREIEVDAVMNLEIARIFHKWLGQQIQNLEAMRPSIVPPPGVVTK